MVVSVLYLIAVFISFILLWALLVFMKYRKSTYFALFFAVILVSNLAFYTLSVSKSLDEALLATKMTYFGATFLILFLILCMCQVCDIEIDHRWLVPMVLVNIEIMVSVFIGCQNGWHYKNVEFVRENGYSYLIKEYGPHHTFYIIVLAIYALLPMAIIIYALKHKNRVSWIYTVLFGVGEFSTILIYFLERALKLKIELLPFSYITYGIILIFILKRASVYDITQNIQLALVSSKDEGYAILNDRRHFIVCNDAARTYFPELNELKVDRPIEQPYLMREFGDWILESLEHPVEPKYYRHGNVDIKVTVRPFFSKNGKKQVGYFIQFENDTINQENIRKLEHLSETDQMTGLYNRRSYETALEGFRGDFHEVTVLEFDINGLKSANDKLGHRAGDELIIAAATCIRESFGTMGRCYRTGGDEFVAIIERDMNRDDRILDAFLEKVEAWKGEVCPYLSVSCGMASAYDYPQLGVDELVATADRKMYEAKAKYYEQEGNDRRRSSF